MASGGAHNYAHLTRIKDQPTHDALRVIFDQLGLLQGLTTATSWRGTVNAGGQTILNLPDAVEASNPVTLQQLQAATHPKNFQQALSISGSNPLDVTALIGSTAFGYGLHADRPSSPPVGGAYFETDRRALYVETGNQWVLAFSYIMQGQVGAWPTTPSGNVPDLGANDVGFYFQDTKLGIIWQWTGGSWHWNGGILHDTWAHRPTAFTGGGGLPPQDAGVMYSATDRGYQTWVLEYSTGKWLLLPGWGEPMNDVIANSGAIGATLGTVDRGFLLYASDYDRVYEWTGAVWADAPAQPTRGMMCDFKTAPGTGWAACDGSLINLTTAAAGLTNYTTQDFVANTPFERLSNSVTTGTFGTAGADYHFTQTMKYVRQ